MLQGENQSRLEAAFQSLAEHLGRRVDIDATVTLLAVAAQAPGLARLPHLPRPEQVEVTRESLSFPERAALGLLLDARPFAFTADARAFLLDVLRRPRLVQDVLADAEGSRTLFPQLGVVLTVEAEGVRLAPGAWVRVDDEGRFAGEAQGVAFSGQVAVDGLVTVTMRGHRETMRLQLD